MTYILQHRREIGILSLHYNFLRIKTKLNVLNTAKLCKVQNLIIWLIWSMCHYSKRDLLIFSKFHIFFLDNSKKNYNFQEAISTSSFITDMIINSYNLNFKSITKDLLSVGFAQVIQNGSCIDNSSDWKLLQLYEGDKKSYFTRTGTHQTSTPVDGNNNNPVYPERNNGGAG